MIAACSWWTAHGSWFDDWRKESGHSTSRCTSTTSSPIGRHSGTGLGVDGDAPVRSRVDLQGFGGVSGPAPVECVAARDAPDD